MSEKDQTRERRTRKETKGLLRRFMAYYAPHKKLFAMDMLMTRTRTCFGM